MIAVIFEVVPHEADRAAYFDTAAELLPSLQEIKGFISVERFQSVSNPQKILSLSFFQDEQSLTQWRNLSQHRQAQLHGRRDAFKNYRIRVASVLRDYGLEDRKQAPDDNQKVHSL